jgi:hypothetical protein
MQANCLSEKAFTLQWMLKFFHWQILCLVNIKFWDFSVFFKSVVIFVIFLRYFTHASEYVGILLC